MAIGVRPQQELPLPTAPNPSSCCWGQGQNSLLTRKLGEKQTNRRNKQTGEVLQLWVESLLFPTLVHFCILGSHSIMKLTTHLTKFVSPAFRMQPYLTSPDGGWVGHLFRKRNPVLYPSFLPFPNLLSPIQAVKELFLSLLPDPWVVSTIPHTWCNVRRRDWCSLTWHVTTLLVTCGIQEEKINKQPWHVHNNQWFFNSSLSLS